MGQAGGQRSRGCMSRFGTGRFGFGGFLLEPLFEFLESELLFHRHLLEGIEVVRGYEAEAGHLLEECSGSARGRLVFCTFLVLCHIC